MRLKPGAGIQRSRQRGVAAIEFALILPFVAVLILALCDYGYYFYIGINATEAARATAVQVSATAAALNGGAGVSNCSTDPLIGTVTGAAPAVPAQTAKNYMLTAVNATFAGYTTATFTCSIVGGKAIFGTVVTVDFPPASGKLHFGLPASSISGRIRYRTPVLYRR